MVRSPFDHDAHEQQIVAFIVTSNTMANGVWKYSFSIRLYLRECLGKCIEWNKAAAELGI
jgi:hypothetical protein